MIIYGSKTYNRVKGVSQELLVCRQCGLRTHYELVHRWRWFTLFFIPVFPFWKSSQIVCPHCGYGVKVNRRNEFDILAHIDDYLTHYDMALPVKSDAISTAQYAQQIGAPVEIDQQKQSMISQIRKKNACFQGCIAAGGFHTLGLKTNGTVVADGDKKQCRVDGFHQIIMVTAGTFHSVGLKQEGTVVTAGGDKATFENISTWSEIVFIDANKNDTVGLKADGTVVGVGLNEGGGCKDNEWKNIISVATSGYHTAALQPDGAVVAMGRNKHGECDTKHWTNIIAVAAAANYTLGLRADGIIHVVGKIPKELSVVGKWRDIVAISAEDDYIVGLKADGSIEFATEVNLYGLKKVSEWENIVAVSTAPRHIVGLKSNGTVVAVGKKSDGCNTDDWYNIGPYRY